MKNKKLVTLMHNDKELLAMFSGMIITVVAMVSLAVTASIWYL